MSSFGLPYMGSKSSIAQWVISKLPPADIFIDLFAGGCAVTHAAILSGKYKRIISNDITDSALIFRDAINGRFHDDDRWISHDEFDANAKNDPYIRFCFSFGYNIEKGYSYSREIEPYKRALHYAVAFQDVQPLHDLGINVPKYCVMGKTTKTRRISIKKYIDENIKLKTNGFVENISRLERMRGLESMQSLERMRGFTAMQGSYDEVELPKGDVVLYCDPPYRNTEGYSNEFDFAAFDDFCRKHKEYIYISEYRMPKDFKRMCSVNKRSLLCASGENKSVVESIWIHDDKYNAMQQERESGKSKQSGFDK